MNKTTTTIVQGADPRAGRTVDIVSGFNLPRYNHVDITATSGTIDHYIFKMDGNQVAVVDLTYTDSTHAVLTTVNRSV